MELTGIGFAEHNTIEKLLAQGGLRLAATLNAIFASSDDLVLGAVHDWATALDYIM